VRDAQRIVCGTDRDSRPCRAEVPARIGCRTPPNIGRGSRLTYAEASAYSREQLFVRGMAHGNIGYSIESVWVVLY
jgi:hypothetical protein